MSHPNDPKVINPAVASIEATPNALVADYKLCFESTADARDAIEAADVLDANLNIPQAVSIAFGALALLAELRPQMVGLPIDLAAIDMLAVYAGAAAYAQALYAVETAPPPALQSAYEHLIQVRTLLRLDAANQAARNIINQQALDGLKGDTGYYNVAYDVISLVSIHEAASPKNIGRTAVTAEELVAARTEASNFLNQLAIREQMLKARSELNEQRRRTVTLLLLAYDEARRTVTFLLWKEPEKHLPSLYTSRGGGRPKANTNPSSDVPATPAAGAPNAAGEPAAAVTNDAAGAAVAPVPGGRGGNPFAGGE